MDKNEVFWKRIEGKKKEEIIDEMLAEAEREFLRKKSRKRQLKETITNLRKRTEKWLRILLHPLGVHHWKWVKSGKYYFVVVECRICKRLTVKREIFSVMTLVKGFLWGASFFIFLMMLLCSCTFIESLVGVSGTILDIYLFLKYILERY